MMLYDIIISSEKANFSLFLQAYFVKKLCIHINSWVPWITDALIKHNTSWLIVPEFDFLEIWNWILKKVTFSQYG